jgi:hypothetical protein
MSDFTPPNRPDDNPFAAPEVAVRRQQSLFGGDLSEAETIRRKYLNHEASIQAIGFLNLLGGVFCIIGGVVAVFFGFSTAAVGPAGEPLPRLLIGGFGIFYVLLGAFSIAIGSGLKNLRNWARVTMAVLIGLSLIFNVITLLRALIMDNTATLIPSLIAVGVGSIIPFLFIRLMVSEKGKMVCSPEYAAIRSQTPHFKYPWGYIIKWVLLFILGMFLLGVLGAVMQFAAGNFPPRPPQKP